MNEIIVAALMTLLPFAVAAEIVEADEQQAHASQISGGGLPPAGLPSGATAGSLPQ